MPKEITIQYIGGLGNQLFQYGFQVYLEGLFPKCRFLAYTGKFKKTRDNNGFELFDFFNVNLSISDELPIYAENGKFFNKLKRKFLGYKKTHIKEISCNLSNFNDHDSYFLEGLWQDYKYVEKSLTYIKKNLKLKNEYLSKAFNYFEFMESDLIGGNNDISRISLHVRRGDYINNPKYSMILGDVCNDLYYENAISYITKKYKNNIVYVYSDDIEWVKYNYKFLNEFNVVFVINDCPISVFYQMMVSDHNIIANSTYSWWAALLNKNNNEVVMPKKWSNSADFDPDLYVDNWVRL